MYIILHLVEARSKRARLYTWASLEHVTGELCIGGAKLLSPINVKHAALFEGLFFIVLENTRAAEIRAISFGRRKRPGRKLSSTEETVGKYCLTSPVRTS
jgi:hypothetical protein